MSTKCPYCGMENIEGVDECERCGQPLNDSHLKEPTTPLERGLFKDCVDILPAKKPVIVEDSTAVGDVVSVIADRGTGCAFVRDAEGRLVGVFSERDALHRLGSKLADHWDQPVAEFMTPKPQSVKHDTKIGFAVHQMDVGHFRHLPIVDKDGCATGVVSVREILGYFTRSLIEAGD